MSDGFELAAGMVKAELQAKLRNLAETTQELAIGSLGKAPGPSAPGSAPNDHAGRIASSIDISAENDGLAVVCTAEQAVYLEIGTAKMAPRPFLLPAFDRACSEIL